MFTVTYAFCWCNISTNYVDYDVIRGQKVTYKLPKWKSTNFKLRKLPQHHRYELSVFLSYFLVQLALLYKKNYINGIEKGLYAQIMGITGLLPKSLRTDLHSDGVDFVREV